MTLGGSHLYMYVNGSMAVYTCPPLVIGLPFRQSLLQMLVVLGSILSVLCVPSILVLHKDPLFRTSRVPLRRSRLYDPCNTLLLDFLSFKATYVATMK
jgi:hypothetical protein